MALHAAVAGGATIQPFHYNDWLSLFTGQMADQPVTIKANETLQAIGGPPSAPTAAPAAGTGPAGVGAVKVAVTFVTADGGETLPGTQATATTTSGNQAVNLSAVPTGPTGTTKRNVYRTVAGGAAFFLDGSINDNTTTTYAIVTTDAALTGHAAAPAHPSFGGSLVIKDSTGVVQFQIFSDGSMSTGAGGLTVGNTTVNGALTVTDASSFDGAKLTTDGTGKLAFAKALSAGNQLMDLQQSYGLFSDNTGGTFGGTTRLWFDSPNNGEMHFGGRASGSVLAGVRFRAQKLELDNNGANALFVNPTFIQSAGAFFGIKNNAGTKLGEFKGDGSFIIGAHNFWTGDGLGAAWAAGSFDTFDVAESYPVAEKFTRNTVVCPGADGLMHRCTHDACPRASVVSLNPGICIGALPEDGEPGFENNQYVALAGRIAVDTAQDIAALAFVCSDGNGGVRPFRDGESGTALGYALVASDSGKVGIFLRPVYHHQAPPVFGQAVWGEATWSE